MHLALTELTVTHPAAEDGVHISVTAWAGHHDFVVVTLRGKLDAVSAPALREQLLSLLHPGASQFVIDLSAIQCADASGLAVLVGNQRRAALLGGGLRLAAPGPEVVGVLTATGIDRHLDVYPTVEAAIAGRAPGAVQPAAAEHVLPAQSRAEPAGSAEPAAVARHAEGRRP